MAVILTNARGIFLFGLALVSFVGCGSSTTSVAPISPVLGPASIGRQLTTRDGPSVEIPMSSADGSDTGTISLRSPMSSPRTALDVSIRRLTIRPGEPCATVIKIGLYNRSAKPLVLDIDGFKLNLRCTPTSPLFGVTLYPISPISSTIVPIKLGDVSAIGKKIVFTSKVVTVTLAPLSASEIGVIAESSTSEIGIPIVPGTPQLLTANAPQLSSTLSVSYGGAGGSGTLYSSACAPAIVGGVLAPSLAHAIIEGTPSFYCTLGTVDSSTVTFGAPSVTFTIGAPIPDQSFIALDGPDSEVGCDASPAPTCVTPQFTVPTITNVIAGNVLDFQSCVPARENTNCNSNQNPAPAPAATSVAAHSAVEILVADDPTYVSPGTAPCMKPAICGGFIVDTSGGSCLINNAPDINGDVPASPPTYKDPGGLQEQPPVTGGISTRAYFPAAGPDVEFDLISGASGTTCSVWVTEADGPLGRTVSLKIPVR